MVFGTKKHSRNQTSGLNVYEKEIRRNDTYMFIYIDHILLYIIIDFRLYIPSHECAVVKESFNIA